MKSYEVRCARVQDPATSDDGTRVLVDEQLPQGADTDAASWDTWIRGATPSAELLDRYGHDPAKRAEFRRRYRRELAAPARQAALDRLRELAKEGTLTLLTADADLETSYVQVLAEILRVPQTDEGGEAACLLPRVCPECGRLADQAPPTTCERCGTQILAI